MLQNLLSDPDVAFEGPGAELMKSDVKTTLAGTSFDGARFVIKRYNCKNIWHRLRLALSRSRAEHSFCSARHLTGIGIITTPPVAWIQETTFGLRARSWFVYEHTDNSIRADALHDGSDPQKIEQMLETMAQNLVLMRQHRLSHGDLKPPNFLITPDRTVLLDLDGLQQHKNTGACERALAKDAARWMRWWEKDDPQPKIGERSRTLLNAAGFAVS
ncbi:MAG TPA: hypothetical protein DG761_11925 [Gammaproteobacteria bacterium]|nr:hypothetical protein [Gammaproteobacteria bacterium]